MIKFVDVTKVYDNNTLALKNVNLTIEKDEFAFLVGPSGSGKSTIIKMLFKELEPTSGNLILDSTEVTNLKKNQIPFYRRKIGIIFQDFKLIPTLNNVNKNGTTILMATHAKDIVDMMRKRVIAIENGTIIRDKIRGTYDYDN